MKKLNLDYQHLGNVEVLTRSLMKGIIGGMVDQEDGNMCNAYCGTGSNQNCDEVCSHCVDAGNGKSTGPGQDKLCVKNPYME